LSESAEKNLLNDLPKFVVAAATNHAAARPPLRDEKIE